MSISENNYNSAVILVIVVLVFSLLNDPVIGKLLLGSQEEEWADFQSADRDSVYLMEKYMLHLTANISFIVMYDGYACFYVRYQLIKRDLSGQSHISNAVQPLIRLLNLQNLGSTTDHDSNTVRPRVR